MTVHFKERGHKREQAPAEREGDRQRAALCYRASLRTPARCATLDMGSPFNCSVCSMGMLSSWQRGSRERTGRRARVTTADTTPAESSGKHTRWSRNRAPSEQRWSNPISVHPLVSSQGKITQRECFYLFHRYLFLFNKCPPSDPGVPGTGRWEYSRAP